MKLFSDIVELETQCKFSDCLHETEPGCTVKKAIRDAKLSNKRLKVTGNYKEKCWLLKEKRTLNLQKKRSGKK